MKKDKFENLRKLNAFVEFAKISKNMNAEKVLKSKEYDALYLAATKQGTNFDSIESNEFYALRSMLYKMALKDQKNDQIKKEKIDAFKNLVKIAYK